MIYHLRCGQSRILLCQTEPALVIHLKFPKFACGRAGLGEKKLAARGRLETGGGREKRHRHRWVLGTGCWGLAIVDFRLPIFD